MTTTSSFMSVVPALTGSVAVRLPTWVPLMSTSFGSVMSG